ncbi:hypothetical protein B0H13DRAFT_2344463 [Mycena leptocephala]|nr:hypothetical protein B0H13DRAFT_2344463 [Mycena leptocephala]
MRPSSWGSALVRTLVSGSDARTPFCPCRDRAAQPWLWSRGLVSMTARLGAGVHGSMVLGQGTFSAARPWSSGTDSLLCRACAGARVLSVNVLDQGVGVGLDDEPSSSS